MRYPENREPNTNTKNISFNIDKEISNKIDRMIKNGWIRNRSEYLRRLIMDDIQFRNIDADIPDLHPELSILQANQINIKNEVIRLHQLGKSVNEIVHAVHIHTNIVQRIICEQHPTQ